MNKAKNLLILSNNKKISQRVNYCLRFVVIHVIQLNKIISICTSKKKSIITQLFSKFSPN